MEVVQGVAVEEIALAAMMSQRDYCIFALRIRLSLRLLPLSVLDVP